jgi:dCMP deaminase
MSLNEISFRKRGVNYKDERVSWDEYFFGIANVVSTRATCPRRQVGCVITYNKRILATGYNGAKPGHPHCLQSGCVMVSGHCKRSVHAEINALDQYLQPELSIRILNKGEGLVMYCTLQPCHKCEKEIKKYLPEMTILWEEDYDNR